LWYSFGGKVINTIVYYYYGDLKNEQ